MRGWKLQRIRVAPSLLVVLVACDRAGEWQPLELEEGQVVIPSTLDDGTAVRCYVDTGSTSTIVRSDLPQDFPLLRVGDLDLVLDTDSDDDPDMHDALLDSVAGGVDCLVGWDSLGETPFTVDYAGARMRLSPGGARTDGVPDLAGDPIVVPFSHDGKFPIVEARVEDVPAQLVVDTGAQAALLPPDLIDRLDQRPDTQQIGIVAAEGVVMGQFGAVRSVTLGGATHEDVDFVSYDSAQLDSAREEGLVVDGALGASSLVRFLVTFDDQRHELTLQPYRRSVQDAQLARFREEMGAPER